MRILLSLIAFVAIILVFPACKDTTVSPLKHVRFDPELLNRLKIADSSALAIANPTGMVLNTKQVQVVFRDNLSLDKQQQFLSTYGFVQQIGQATPADAAIAYNVELVDGLNQDQLRKAIYLLSQDAAIAKAEPTFLAVRATF
ncbi:hypothetical protein FVR03_06250 [Pontibacter qinzhouensis]|uniref:Uncharacterized protein n=1 Tax=Pontibacter qinzhouensis TaxID=2603253 RepID=A0A5C8KD51_9BACT|nr:hypothetical protein [Pontibacter qinzhouensis]TXK49691.1 hypothetical protein FVR03_06250 [Pontibacter qinzhouensis]